MKKRIISLVGVLAVVISLVVGVVGCASQPHQETSIMVYCGAGMKKPMDEIGELFQQQYGTEVQYNYAGSDTLLSQMELTRKGDVYIPGATMYIDKAREKGLIDYEQRVAYHVPVIAVPEGNPANITCLDGLTKPGVKVILGDAKVAACGKMAKKILEKKGIFDAVEPNVVAYRDTASKLVVDMCMGTAEVTINWQASFVGTEDKTDLIEIPREQNIIKIIPIGTTTFSERQKVAKEFVDFCASDQGKAIFNKHGFTAYPSPKYE